MSQADAPDSAEQGGAPPNRIVARALSRFCRLVPEGSNKEIVAALTVLVEHGDAAALHAVEAHLASAPLALSYGDRDDDPSWDLTPRVFQLLARWWEWLGLADERAAWLVEDWLNPTGNTTRHFGPNSFTFFTRIAPHLAPRVASLLIHACADRKKEQRIRAAGGLLYTPTGSALDALVVLLGDRVEQVANQARFSLTLLAAPRTSGSTRLSPAAPDAVALRLIDVLASDTPALQLQALAAFSWFAGMQHRLSITFPPQFARVFPAIVRLLVSPHPEVQRRAAQRVNAAGYHLDMLRPSRAAALASTLHLPPLDLLALPEHPDKEVVHAALYLAGRITDTVLADDEELGARLLARLDSFRGDYVGYIAALYALGRLQTTAAIPVIARHLDSPKDGFHVHAVLVLARLGYHPVIPFLDRLLHDLTYRDDAREALDLFPPA